MSTIDYDKPTDFLLLSIAIPLIGKLLVAELYGIVDTFFVGRFLGGSSLGALGLVTYKYMYSVPYREFPGGPGACFSYAAFFIFSSDSCWGGYIYPAFKKPG